MRLVIKLIAEDQFDADKISTVSSVSSSSSSPNDVEAWGFIRRRLEGIGIRSGIFERIQDFILSKFRHVIPAAGEDYDGQNSKEPHKGSAALMPLGGEYIARTGAYSDGCKCAKCDLKYQGTWLEDDKYKSHSWLDISCDSEPGYLI